MAGSRNPSVLAERESLKVWMNLFVRPGGDEPS